MRNPFVYLPTNHEVITHFREYIATVMPPGGLHVKAVTGITYTDRCVTVHIDPAQAGAEDWAFNQVFGPICLAEVYGTAIGFDDDAGARIRKVVDKVTVLHRNGEVYSSIDTETVHRKCAGAE